MSALLTELGEHIKSLREKSHLSQRELASRINITQAHLSHIENGQVNLTAQTLFHLIRNLEHDLMFIPRQEISTVKAILKTRESPEKEWSTPPYTPDKEEE